LGGDRPDVQNAYNRPDWRYSGFSFSIPISDLAPGQHTVEVRAYNNANLSATASKAFTAIGSNNPYFNSYGVAPSPIQQGGTATVSWNAGDVDGDFSRVEVYVTRWGSPYWDYLGSFAAVGSTSWTSSEHFTSSQGGYGTYLFVVRAFDRRGGFTDSYATFDINSRTDEHPDGNNVLKLKLNRPSF